MLLQLKNFIATRCLAPKRKLCSSATFSCCCNIYLECCNKYESSLSWIGPYLGPTRQEGGDQGRSLDSHTARRGDGAASRLLDAVCCARPGQGDVLLPLLSSRLLGRQLLRTGLRWGRQSPLLGIWTPPMGCCVRGDFYPNRWLWHALHRPHQSIDQTSRPRVASKGTSKIIMGCTYIWIICM
jgi:hypothetical protein